MSKSLGNSPDPLDLIERFGADGVRMGMMLSAPAGNDILFDESLCEQGRNFCNKIWNCFRLIKGFEVADIAAPKGNQLAIQWFDALLAQTEKEIIDLFSKYRLSEALMAVYKLYTDEFSGWYLEMIKPAYGQPIDKQTYEQSLAFFDRLLKLLHPFMPFITEELWQNLYERKEGESIMVSPLETLKTLETLETLEEMENLKQKADEAERNGDYAKVAEIRYGKMGDLQQKIQQLEAQKAANENPLINEEVNPEDIAEVVAKWTGIPVKRMLQSEKDKLLHLEEELHKRVIGQDEAIKAVSDAVRRSRAGLQNEKRPLGSFLFLGTTGVGKTELAKALAEFLFNDENLMTRIDMSEYQESFAVTRLVGAPPGYVGYDEGGQLTEAVRRKPYSVVLFDEIEKAHPDVFNVLLQVLDDGRLTDGKGRTVNFKNTILIMTSNVGSDIIQDYMLKINDVNKEQALDDCKNAVMEVLKRSVRPEFLNRIDEVIMFEPLSSENIRGILMLQIKQIQDMLEEKGMHLQFTPAALEYLASKGYDIAYGARPIKRLLQKELINELATQIIGGKIQPGGNISVDCRDGALHFS
jgi:ATP-dependent Clp protease ATP-binding subunit ClpB